MSDFDEMHDAMIDAAIEEMGDEVVASIQAIEREMIIEFIRRDENLYECGEELATMIEELGHYEDDSIH